MFLFVPLFVEVDMDMKSVFGPTEIIEWTLHSEIIFKLPGIMCQPQNNNLMTREH